MLVWSLLLAGGVLKVCYLLRACYVFVDAWNPFACCDFHGQCPEWTGVRPAADGARKAAYSIVILRRGAKETLGDAGNKILGSPEKKMGEILAVAILPGVRKQRKAVRCTDAKVYLTVGHYFERRIHVLVLSRTRMRCQS